MFQYNVFNMQHQLRNAQAALSQETFDTYLLPYFKLRSLLRNLAQGHNRNITLHLPRDTCFLLFRYVPYLQTDPRYPRRGITQIFPLKQPAFYNATIAAQPVQALACAGSASVARERDFSSFIIAEGAVTAPLTLMIR